ncbi:MAG: glycosyltransferase [Planctomycetota bacterium]|nr:glycosyltransferase [Planctomycetota bacterium]
MRIAFDYTAAASHWPGVGRYGRELVRALVRREDCPELVLFEHGRAEPLPARALGLDTQLAASRVERVRLDGSRRAWAWRARFGLKGPLERGAAMAGVDLVHRAFPAMPPVRGRSQVLPLFELPTGLGVSGVVDLAERESADAALAAELRSMTRILTGSTSGRIEAAERLGAHGVEPWRLHAVTTGSDHWLRDAEPRDSSALAAAGPPRLLVLGALSPMRQPVDVLHGFEALCERLGGPTDELPVLHFDGRSGEAAAELRALLAMSNVGDRVTLNPHPEEAALPELVAGSTVLVHLSAGELSPITPLEALQFGTAVVASNLPAFDEALGDEQLVDDPSDADALGEAMLRALASGQDDEARRVRQSLASFYTWDACAADHIALWQAAIDDPDLEA